MSSKARQLADAIYTRISNVRIANGYNTDIGAKVYRGKRTADEAEIPFAFIIEGDDNPLEQQSATRVRVSISFAVEGHTTCDPNNPNDAAHDIVEDLTRAIFGGDSTFGGIVIQRSGASPGLTYKGRTISQREDGSKVIGAGVLFDCELFIDLANP